MYMIQTDEEAENNPLLFVTYKRALEYRFSALNQSNHAMQFYVKPITVFGSERYSICDMTTNQPLPGSVTDDPLMAENMYKSLIEMSHQ